VRHVSLSDDIHKKYPAGVSDDQLRLFLRESAGVDVTDTSSVAVDVSKILLLFAALILNLPMGLRKKQMERVTLQRWTPDFEEYRL